MAQFQNDVFILSWIERNLKHKVADDCKDHEKFLSKQRSLERKIIHDFCFIISVFLQKFDQPCTLKEFL